MYNFIIMKSVSILALTAVAAQAAVPTAIFHGLGDACANRGMKEFTQEIAMGTGAHAECVEIGFGSTTSIFENFEEQAETACQNILANKNFQGEFNIIGLSQGGLLARSVAERCPVQGKVRNLVTLGGPH